MFINKLIFSVEPLYRLLRHLLFWSLFSAGFFVQSLVPRNASDFYAADIYFIALTSTFCFLPACILSLYTAIYFVWPRLLRQKKYTAAFVILLMVFVVDIVINFFFSGLFHSSSYVIDSGRGFGGRLGLAYLNSIWAVTVMGIGLFIKIGKLCYVQQRENLHIAKRSMRTQLDVEKSRLRPAYLYNSLAIIQQKTTSLTDSSGEMILKLSDVLSYTLYESDADFVPLNTELAAILDFIEFEKMKHAGDEQITFDWDTPEDFTIPPMLILSFLQEVITQSAEYGRCDWRLSVSISAEHESLHIRMQGHYPEGIPDFSAAARKLRKRVETVYPPATFDIQYLSRETDFTLFVHLNGLYELESKAETPFL